MWTHSRSRDAIRNVPGSSRRASSPDGSLRSSCPRGEPLRLCQGRTIESTLSLLPQGDLCRTLDLLLSTSQQAKCPRSISFPILVAI